MKAFVYHQYGAPRVLQLAWLAKPGIGDDQVLIKVGAAAINPLDWHYMRGMPYVARPEFGLRKPKR